MAIARSRRTLIDGRLSTHGARGGCLGVPLSWAFRSPDAKPQRGARLPRREQTLEVALKRSALAVPLPPTTAAHRNDVDDGGGSVASC